VRKRVPQSVQAGIRMGLDANLPISSPACSRQIAKPNISQEYAGQYEKHVGTFGLFRVRSSLGKVDCI
jgi:hypothetical protein